MKKIFILVCLFILQTQVVSAEVTSFAFVTEPQSIAVNATSSVITVGSESSPGVSEKIPNTFDLVFTSTSPTGKFLSSAGKESSSVTMSKNTATRSVYYQDSTEGTFTLSLVATMRDTTTSFSTTQQITVGTSAGSVASTTETVSQKTTTENTAPPAPALSAHSSPVPLSTLSSAMDFEISAGRNRLSTVGNAVAFKAVPTRAQNVPEQNISYLWSFGDGTTANGQSVEHRYRFAGDYTVVVNGSYADKQAVSRTLVTILLPTVSFSQVSGGIEIKNNTKNEINIEGWKINAGVHEFVFPKDTIIGANKSIVFPEQTVGFLAGDILLSNPLGDRIAQIMSASKQVKENTEMLVSVEQKLADISKQVGQLAQIPQSQNTIQIESQKLPSIIKGDTKENIASTDVATTTSIDLAKSALVFVAPASPGLVTSIFSFPIKGFQFIKHLFVEE